MVLLQLLAVTSRSLSKFNKLTNQFQKQYFPVVLELSDMNSIDKALTKLKDFEPIDVLVNNAGHGYRAAIEEGEDTRIKQLYATNLFGPIKLIQKLLPHMREERSGAIINISSTA